MLKRNVGEGVVMALRGTSPNRYVLVAVKGPKGGQELKLCEEDTTFCKKVSPDGGHVDHYVDGEPRIMRRSGVVRFVRSYKGRKLVPILWAFA